MDVSASIALDALALAVLLLILINLMMKNFSPSLDKRLFSWLMLALICFYVFDIFYYLLYGKDIPNNALYLRILKCIYFFFNNFICFLWMFYVDFKIFSSRERLKKMAPFYAIPFILNTLLVIGNLFFDWIFSITPAFAMQAESQMWTTTLLTYAYAVSSFYLLIRYRKNVQKNVYTALFMFVIPPLALSILQISLRSVSLICGYSLSSVIVYLHTQNSYIVTDSLTDTYNRRYLSNYLSNEIARKDPSTFLMGIMFDVDDFKGVNDNYGHLVGDKILEHLSTLIKESIGSRAFLARYAGDEFVVVVRDKDPNAIIEIMNRITQNTLAHNNVAELPYKLNFSMGYYVCKDIRKETVDSFIKSLDDAMYRVKAEKHKRAILKASQQKH